tara:strand:+ start:1454 stop:1849 length:396 start_codon:yes stop_codon:yes gene_type:complete
MGKLILVACKNDDELRLYNELSQKASFVEQVGEISLSNRYPDPPKLAKLVYYLNCYLSDRYPYRNWDEINNINSLEKALIEKNEEGISHYPSYEDFCKETDKANYEYQKGRWEYENQKKEENKRKRKKKTN